MTHELADAQREPQRLPASASPGMALSPAQLRLWFLSQLDPDSPVGNLALALRLQGKLDIRALERSLDRLLARHRILRTRFLADEGSPRAVVAPALSGGVLLREEQPSPTGVEPLAHAREWVQQQARCPFELGNGPLFRAALLELSDFEHVLVLSTHRIVCDRRSLQIAVDEIGGSYDALSTGRPARLVEQTIDYASLAERRLQALDGPEGERLLDYWIAAVGSDPPVLDLPADRVRPAAQTFRGDAKRIVIELETRRRLAAFEQRGELRSPAVMLAVLLALVHRYTGAEDVAVGLEVEGRSASDSAAVIGPLANTLVLRQALDGNTSFDELVLRVSKAIENALAHDELPFASLVEAVEPERSLSHSPLFQISLEQRAATDGTATFGELFVDPLEVDLGTAATDLALSVADRAGELMCELQYSTDLFDTERIDRLGGHYLTLLHSALASAESAIGSLAMLSDPEVRQLLVEWNETQSEYPASECTHELFEHQVDQRAEAIAARCGSQQLSYGALERRANQLAAWLRRAGAGPDVLIALCMPRSLEMLIAALAVMKAGGAYVPLDPAYPAQRLAFMLEDSQAGIVLTTAELAARFQFAAEHVLCMDRDAPELEQESPARLEGTSGPEHLAYVIYTSGSTGKPKGVQISHAALVNLLWSFKALSEIEPGQTLVAITSLSFDIAGLELFMPLVAGAQVVIATGEQAAHGGELATLLAGAGATIMQGTPSSWRLLLDAGWDGRPLRIALCGGEALAPDLVAALIARVPNVWNVYGPTETTIWSCAAPLHSPAPQRIPIGRPIANTEVYLLDPDLQPVPIGVPGELYLGGDGVARGYLNRPGLTSERFIAHPFSERPGARIYRTGDLASYRSDGTIDFLGRTDHQVKVRGFRIELGEIEANLGAHPDVASAVVVARDDGRERRLVAYVVAAGEQAPELMDLYAWLRRTLPDYMLPEAAVALERMPLTPNGKVDRKALPDPPRGDTVEEIVAPAGRDERELQGIWRELLGLDRAVGVTESFFELGGNSLLAARLLAIVERSFHRRLPLTVMFEDPTIRGLAGAIHARALNTSIAMVDVQAGGSRPPLFCFSLALGGVLALRHMVRPLGDQQPVLAFLVAALPWVDSASRIEDIAATFAREVVERQPEGPLFLFGHSLGGLVAYELARQLAGSGREIAPVTMIDTLCPSVWRRGGVARRTARRVVRQIRRIRNPAPQRLFVPGTDQQQWAAVEAVITRYVPGPYSGPVTIFGTPDDVSRAGDELLGWGELMRGETDVHILPGNHISILRPPHVDEFSARYVPMLREWQAALS